MKKYIGISIGIIVIAGGIYGLSMNQQVEQPAPVVVSDQPSVEGEVVSVGTYETYSPEKIAQAATGDVVLFFHASWCPSCRALNKDIEKNAARIPEGVTILKVDYDTETALKQTYGVTSQHTLVQVDENGTLVKKWSGGSRLETVLAQIQ